MKPLVRVVLCMSVLFLVLGTLGTVNVQATEYGTRVLKLKDEGSDVAILQFLLRDAGYYTVKVDGIFGGKTREAVIHFQRGHGLDADGVVGQQTYLMLPQLEKLPSRGNFSWDDVIFLARVIHAEARGESFRGQVAVGAVILNRVDHTRFPSTIRDVILQEGQFCTLADGQVNLYPSKTAIEAAKAAMIGYDPTGGALFFYNPKTASKRNWVATRPVSIQIGEHIFAF